MQTFAERSERHGNVLEVLCGHMATVVDGAFHRVLKAGLPEEKDQAALVFDRLSRGLRLTISMEAKLHRDIARDAREIERFASEPVTAIDTTVHTETVSRPSVRIAPVYQETERESEADYESSDTSLDIHIKDLDALIEAQPATFAPRRKPGRGLAGISGDWVAIQDAANAKPKRQRRRKAYPGDNPGPQGPPPLDAVLSAMAAPPWRGSG